MRSYSGNLPQDSIQSPQNSEALSPIKSDLPVQHGAWAGKAPGAAWNANSLEWPSSCSGNISTYNHEHLSGL